MPEVAVIIPARYASTRLPAKPLALISGRPLIQHVWERCLLAKGVARVIVATDDERIATVAAAFGAEVAMTSTAHRSGTDRIAEVAGKLCGITHIINVQGDEPLMDPKLITKLAKTLLSNDAIDMITSANPFPTEAGAKEPHPDVANPHIVKVVLDRAGDALYFSRSAIPFVRADGVTPTFYRHHGLYGYSRKFLLKFVKWPPGMLEQAESLEQLRALENGAKLRVVLTDAEPVGVDTPADIALMERLLAEEQPRRPRRAP